MKDRFLDLARKQQLRQIGAVSARDSARVGILHSTMRADGDRGAARARINRSIQ
jgi:hypothetical protein